MAAGMRGRVLLCVLLSTNVLSNSQDKGLKSSKSIDKDDEATPTGEADKDTCSVPGEVSSEEVGKQYTRAYYSTSTCRARGLMTAIAKLRSVYSLLSHDPISKRTCV